MMSNKILLLGIAFCTALPVFALTPGFELSERFVPRYTHMSLGGLAKQAGDVSQCDSGYVVKSFYYDWYKKWQYPLDNELYYALVTL
jgi:hypothetical protein